MDDLDMPADRANMRPACMSWRLVARGATRGSCLEDNVAVGVLKDQSAF